VALTGLLAALAFVAIAFVARPAPLGERDGTARSSSAPVALGQLPSNGHPDFVGVGDPRPSARIAHLAAAPATRWSLALALAVVAVAVSVGLPAPHGSRWRRWRARLEGAPPAVA
jgi:hypothetical protein